ncbi:hypothetical protein DPQ22_07140 [Candidatus Tokpelaia sp.]|nr:hypothetical protein DPQ22_07140 [Candidatus Tokpelaia sp.]
MRLDYAIGCNLNAGRRGENCQPCFNLYRQKQLQKNLLPVISPKMPTLKKNILCHTRIYYKQSKRRPKHKSTPAQFRAKIQFKVLYE